MNNLKEQLKQHNILLVVEETPTGVVVDLHDTLNDKPIAIAKGDSAEAALSTIISKLVESKVILNYKFDGLSQL